MIIEKKVGSRTAYYADNESKDELPIQFSTGDIVQFENMTGVIVGYAIVEIMSNTFQVFYEIECSENTDNIAEIIISALKEVEGISEVELEFISYVAESDLLLNNAPSKIWRDAIG